MKLIAHRGATKNAPENTLTAFRKALEFGTDAIETDIHETLDGVLVIHHDYYLGHPDNGVGMICDKKYKYIQSLQIGNEKIPLFEDILKLCKDKCSLELELKGLTPQFLEHVYKLIQGYNMESDIEFTSPHLPLLMGLKQMAPHVKIGYFVPNPPPWMDIGLFKKITLANTLIGGFDAAHFQSALITKDIIDSFHDKRILVHAADCNDKMEMKRVEKLGVDQLSTDDIETAIKTLKE